LLKHLDRQVIEPLVVVPDQGIFRERFAELGLTVLTPGHFPERTAQQRFDHHNRATAALSYAWNLGDSAWLIPDLVRIIKQHGIELVYCNNMMVKPLGAPAAQLSDVPAVLHVRNLHERPVAIALYCQTVARLPAVQLIIANSAASAVPYQRAVPEKVEIVHNGVDLEEYAPGAFPVVPWRERIGAAAHDLLIGFTGNLVPRKGVDVLIRAFARVQARRPDLQLLIAGRVPIGSPTDYREHYAALARSLGVEARVHFLGFVADVRPLVRALDVLVLPSLQEPFGRSIIEAMALGTPVIASRVGGIPEVLDDGVDGLLVPPADDLALGHALERLVSDAALRTALSARAEQEVRARFDVARLTEQMQQLLLRAAGRVPAAPSTEPQARV
ncbi:MAG TPA: glycosyltransferase family 4 protein, partial [Polyangiales bacterium]|nr:glycosyltransferase family 4 protein [Polyangiales bacterium]